MMLTPVVLPPGWRMFVTSLASQVFGHGYDGNASGRCLHRKSRGIAECRNHRRSLRDEIRGESWQSIYLAVGETKVEGDIPAFNVTEGLHVGTDRLRESFSGLARKNEQNAEYWYCRLLRPHGQRPRGGCTAEE